MLSLKISNKAGVCLALPLNPSLNPQPLYEKYEITHA
jgi:hypothetical protein